MGDGAGYDQNADGIAVEIGDHLGDHISCFRVQTLDQSGAAYTATGQNLLQIVVADNQTLVDTAQRRVRAEQQLSVGTANHRIHPGDPVGYAEVDHKILVDKAAG